MEYPERTKRIKALQFLQNELQNAFSRGEDALEIEYRKQYPRALLKEKTEVPERWLSVSLKTTHEHIPPKLGLSVPECVNLLEALASNGYINMNPILTGRRGSRRRKTKIVADYSVGAWMAYRVIHHLTDMGLREIGELPDPQAQLIQGFEAAIEAIKHDNRLTDVEKRQKINWLEEGKIVVRTLSIDAIKALLAGAIL